MARTARRRHGIFLLASTILILLFISYQDRLPGAQHRRHGDHLDFPAPAFDWTKRNETHPVSSYLPIPRPQRRQFPRVQHNFGWFTGRAQVARQQAVKKAFQRCWQAYKEHAWLKDELRPTSGTSKDHFAGWAATLVDSLDTLWIMGLKAEFEEAVQAVVTIDFSVTKSGDSISLFETTIRYLGGLLGSYDLSGDSRLLVKAVELGHTLYGAFDTPNRMPRTYFDVNAVTDGAMFSKQVADYNTVTADVGSLTLEFTRLSQLTGDPKWHDAVARIMTAFAAQRLDPKPVCPNIFAENQTNVPGMFPTMVNSHEQDFHSGTQFTVGALSDSVYEYILKMVALLGGSDVYETMYNMAVDAIVKHIIFRPMVPGDLDILLAGKVSAFDTAHVVHQPDAEHLGCFIGGLMALGGRMLSNRTHIEIGRKLTDGCIWSYDALPLGIGPEDMSLVACESRTHCPWNESTWHAAVLDRHPPSQVQYSPPRHVLDVHTIIRTERLPPAFAAMTNKHYILRPEALESVFVLYRITGDPKLRDDAWRMFTRIQNATRTDLANSAISDVTDPAAPKMDEMESFWLAETLKYLYLIFSDSTLVNLDDWVFNTEAHPLRRSRQRGWIR
ncbi:hypothetical protein LTR56_011159 [Elasticomyces elasticus]|nr:hypothetical protein LTR56_011159 [Elasticomyces elasticus]KAK3662420.1 hypothetical protein LTR22_006699 [Elasticomyces elasticus]KAK4926409.1 hypothetical protein LTR49_006616 [Elasticomyces elasticus]KAK5761218.1 hypothetical protein LTS12_008699 [Elasticomyces elasticus]